MPPNILLIIADSVRARNTSVYGHTNNTTPFLEDFAETATIYEHGYSPGAKSLTSHTSLFTGLHVEEHNMNSADHRLTPGYSIFERLRDDFGYATGVFSENTWITDVDVGLKDGFETVEGPRDLLFPDAVDPKSFVAEAGRGEYTEYLRACLTSKKPIRSLANGLATKLAWDYPMLLPDSFKASTTADIYGDLFLDWERTQDGPWAACLNFMDAHIPYEPAEEHDRWGGKRARRLQNSIEDQKWSFYSGNRPWWQRKALESLYDGAIRQIDAEIEHIVSTLDDRGVLDDTLVVITSDHGEGFGEPSEIRPDIRVAEHGVASHEVLLHVPLIVKYPGQTDGATVSEPASLTQFPSTVQATIEDDVPIESFVPDGPVIASALGLNKPLQQRARQYVDDLSPYTATTRIAYHYSDGFVEKQMIWRDQNATVAVRDAQTSYVSGHEAPLVEDAFESITDIGVREGTGGMDSVDDSTRQRLEDLGYV